MVSPTTVGQGVWLVAGRFCGFCRAWIAGVASAILELTIALGCCCGRGEREMRSAAVEGDRGSVGCCPLAGEEDEEGNEGCRVFTSCAVMVKEKWLGERWEMVALVL
jgi:hypothetical protein